MQKLSKATMRNFAGGKRSAFDQVFNLFFSPLCFLANKIVNNLAVAEDITMISLNHVMQNHADFTEFSKLKAFLYITVANKCRKHLRDTLKTVSLIDEEAVVDDNTIINAIIKTELIKEIIDESDALPPLRKKVFDLYYICGLSNEEIAKKLKLKLGAIYTHKNRAIQQIKKALHYEVKDRRTT